MSRMWSPTASDLAQSAPIWAKPEEARSFTPWTNAVPASPEAAPPISEYLDPEAIRDQAYADGLAEGRRTVEAELAAERDAVARLAEVLENLRPEPPRELGLLLAETVKRLVRRDRRRRDRSGQDAPPSRRSRATQGRTD